jgi:beta-glucanase (GH16 family)
MSNHQRWLLALLACAAVAWGEPPAGYQLAWQDEFNGRAVDTTRWLYRTDSKLWSTQLPANVSVANGNLVLTLKKEDAGDKHYTGGGVISREAFFYGYYECRFRIDAGAGWHSSFWLMRHDGQGGTGTGQAALELDVIENASINPHAYSTTTHKWPAPHEQYGHRMVPVADVSRYHIYGCLYTPAEVRYYLDDAEVQKVDIATLPQAPLNIWLTSIAAHLGKTERVDDTRLPGHVYYDYIRYYTR